MIRIWQLVLIIIIVSAASFGAGYWVADLQDRSAVAAVNGVEITRAELEEALWDRAGEQILDDLIIETILAQAAAEAGIEVTDEEVEAEIEAIAASYPSREMFEATISQYGWDRDELKEQVRWQLLLERLATQGIEVSEEQIQAFWKMNKERYPDKTMEEMRDYIIRAIKKEHAGPMELYLMGLKQQAEVEIMVEDFKGLESGD